MALLQADGPDSGQVQLVAVLVAIGWAVHWGAGRDVLEVMADCRDALPDVARFQRSFPPRRKHWACGPLLVYDLSISNQAGQLQA